jgi:hypothetical protein
MDRDREEGVMEREERRQEKKRYKCIYYIRPVKYAIHKHLGPILVLPRAHVIPLYPRAQSFQPRPEQPYGLLVFHVIYHVGKYDVPDE